MARLLTLLALVLVVWALPGHCWDSEEMELFDLVEEVGENFYEVLGISQDATTSEVKKAYRRLSLQLHPDKNDAPDADVKFRQLVAIYDVLRDEGRRARYEKVLVEGLPDWRSPIYYYRRARKMSLLEISIILTVVISITQYLMAWGSYIDKKHSLEEFLIRKYKIKDRKKRKGEDLQNISKMEEELSLIPKPSWWNILPIQLVKLVIFLVVRKPRPEPSSIPVITGGPWTDEEFSELARLMAKYPGGTVDRWERIAETMGRTVYEVTKMSEKVKARLAQRFSDMKYEESMNEVKVKVKTRAEKTDLAAGSDEAWNTIQQKALEKALKQFPKGTDQRWDRIAKAVPEKTKEECMLRFKFLAEKIRKKKEEAEKPTDDDHNEEQSENAQEEELDEAELECKPSSKNNLIKTNSTKRNSLPGDDREEVSLDQNAEEGEEDNTE
ncbi:putative dnaJ-like subfamily C member 1-like [Penaeus vannamei]|uniref:Putative dnaJ-like subfamily C member 1-like n=1 Tax=Penaeus vannamei TaxID=6689 RepID=A0A3R7Q4G8_PENVA|nr:putative dnaJ-like subfamily C member 1-like [Penaeus vannamei]